MYFIKNIKTIGTKCVEKIILLLFASFLIFIFALLLYDTTFRINENITLNFFIKLFFLLFVSLFSILFIWAYNKLSLKNISLRLWQQLVIILIVTSLPRILSITFIKVIPSNDFLTYHTLASKLSKGSIAFNNYISMFPHVIGYPSLLAIFYKLFGSFAIVANILNIILACGISVFLFIIGSEIKNVKCGFWTAVLWALCPSQILYTNIICAEYIFTFLLFLFLCLLIILLKKLKNFLTSIISFCMLGILCALTNALRPLGILIVLSVLIFYFTFYKQKGYIFNVVFTKFILIFAFLIFYFISNLIINSTISTVIKRDAASFPVGFTMYIGSDAKYGGIWNYDDSIKVSKIESESKMKPQEIHDYLLKQALHRFKQQGIKENISLFINKFKIMWLGDIDAVFIVNNPSATYNLGSSNNLGNNINIYFILGIAISLLYYYFLLTLCILYIISYSENVKSKYSLLLVIFILGMVLLHLLVEVAPRYHFYGIPLFSLIASLGVSNLRVPLHSHQSNNPIKVIN
ncbi:hypothetical protein [Clostridium sp. AWRP]|uniref:hypothetical protein n=1 Tax=Clostridium sp. AWRP TaxID=2212991 RepID=UPI000FD7A556|nr:hypothetical protein [Clostridium sp. AWRP]AZV57261.1 hypothetical protein DMR38_11965 [Clostridium sp. AWRP]